MVFSRGVTPSRAVLLCVPIDNMDLPPSELRFDFGNVNVRFQDAAILASYIRRRAGGKGWLMSVTVADRRWRWAYGSISGEFNRRTPSGLVDTNTRQTVADLMSICLNAMGESGFNVSQVPGNVFPYINWRSVNPALALASLCDYVACDVVLNHLTNQVEIWPLGTGPGTLTGFGEEHEKFRYIPRANVPSQIEVHGGPSRFQNKLKLRAISHGFTGQQSLIANTGIDFTKEALHFPGFGNEQPLALDQVWRDFRVVGQADGSLAVPNCPETINSVDQYLLDDYLLDPAELDIDGFFRPLPYEIGGDYWPYADTPDSVTNTYWIGHSTLEKDRKILRLKQPVVKLSSTGLIQEPSMFLVTSYRVRSETGDPVRLFRFGSLGGNGGRLILHRPEIFASFVSTYSSGGSGTNISGSNSTLSTATQEADNYVQMFQRKYQGVAASQLTYPGIIAGNLNGNVCQATWECGVNRPAKTMASEHEEHDTTAIHRTERRRREVLRQIAESLEGLE